MDFDRYLKDVSNHLDFCSNSLVDIGNGLLLTNKEIEVLKNYNIPYNNCKNLKELIFLLEGAIDEYDDSEDLLEIESSISERDYYLNTNK